MVDELIREVDSCLENGCYMAALMVALTLPDICAKAEYGVSKKDNKKNYIAWYNSCIEQGLAKTDGASPSLEGELVYLLRCSVLHQGTPNVDEKQTGITHFELVWQEHEGAHRIATFSEVQLCNEEIISKKYSVNIRELCSRLCEGANCYYKANKDRFDFIKYNLSNMDFQTRQIFQIET